MATQAKRVQLEGLDLEVPMVTEEHLAILEDLDILALLAHRVSQDHL